MTNVHRTTGIARLAALALGTVVAVSGQHAEAASVTSSGVTGGCAAGIVTPSSPPIPSDIGVIDVLAGGSWDVTFETGDLGGSCFFTLQNTSSSAFAATISVITVDQDRTQDVSTGAFTSLYGFDTGAFLVSPEVSSNPSGVLAFFPEGVGLSGSIDFNIARNREVTFDWLWGTPFGFGEGAPRIAFSVTATPVPLPAAGWLMIAGLGGLAALRRRKRAA